MPPKPRPTQLKPVEPAAQQIRQFHELGKLVLTRADTDHISILAAAEVIALGQGISYDRSLKAARFASLFDEKGLDRLDRLCEFYLLTINHIRRVLRVKSKSAPPMAQAGRGRSLASGPASARNPTRDRGQGRRRWAAHSDADRPSRNN